MNEPQKTRVPRYISIIGRTIVEAIYGQTPDGLDYIRLTFLDGSEFLIDESKRGGINFKTIERA